MVQSYTDEDYKDALRYFRERQRAFAGHDNSRLYRVAVSLLHDKVHGERPSFFETVRTKKRTDTRSRLQILDEVYQSMLGDGEVQ